MARRQQTQQTQQQLRINRQTPARRCEVCHQSDEFNPTTNSCSRCANVEAIDQEIIVLRDEELDQEPGVVSLAELAATFGEIISPTASTPTASTATLNADDRRQQLLDDRELLLDRRQERIGAREQLLGQREETLDQRDNDLENERRRYSNENNGLLPALNLRSYGSFNTRAIIAVVCLIIVVFTIAVTEMSSSPGAVAKTNQLKTVQPIPIVHPVAQEETSTEKETNTEEIPFQVDIDANPEKVQDNPTVVLGVGNVTILDLQEQPKEIIVGDKEVVEISKSTNNLKRLYLVGKAATSGSNFVIETTSGKTLTIFFRVVENASVGDFNGEVKVKNDVEDKR
jgi:hypothetical protein